MTSPHLQDADLPERPQPPMRSAMAWGFLNFAVCQIGAFLVFLLLARILDPAVFGVFAIAIVILDLVAVQGKYAMIDAIVIEGAMGRRQLSGAFWICMGVCVLSAVIMGGGFVIAETLLDMAGLGAIGIALSATLLLIPLQTVTEGQLFGRLQVRSLAMRNIAMTVFGAIAGIMVAFGPHPEWALAAQRGAQTAAATVLLWMATRFWPSLTIDVPGTLAVLRRAAGIWRNFLLAATPRFVLQIAMGAALGAALLGVYRILERFAELVQQALVAPLMNLVVPVVSRYGADRNAAADQAIGLIRNAAAFSVPAFAGLAVLANDAMQALLEPPIAKYHGVLSTLALAGLYAPITVLRVPILGALKRNGLLTAQLLLDFVLAALVAWLLSPRGLEAVAWGLFGVASCSAAVGWVSMAHCLNVRKSRILFDLAPAYLGAGAMALGLWGALAFVGQPTQAGLDWRTLVRLGALVVAGFCMYGVYLLAVQREWLLNALRAFRDTRTTLTEPE